MSPGTAPHSSRVNPKPVLRSIHLSPDLQPPVPLPVPIPRSVALHPVETIKDPAPRMRTGRHVSPELAVARVPAAGGGDGSVGGGGCGLRTAELALGAGSRRGRRRTCLAPSGWPWVGGTEGPFPARVCHAGSRNRWTAGATFVGARARPSSPEADAVLLLCSVAIPEVTPKSLPAGWGACSSLLLEMRDTGGRGGHGEAAGQCALPPR